MAGLSITVELHPVLSVVCLEGDLDRLTEPQLTRTFNRLLTDHTPKIIVDAAELHFCDSTGLWTFIMAQRRAGELGGGVRLVGAHGPLARLLAVTQLVDLFPPYASFAQAAHWPLASSK